MSIILFANNGVHQCWSCGNRIGKTVRKHIFRDADCIEREMVVALPECKVAHLYMTEVYETPCSKYVQMTKAEGERE